MNIHDKIELPPLPEGEDSSFGPYSVYTAEQMQAYAIAAIEAALQSQDREDAAQAEWMACESRRPWVTNSLKYHIKELRDAEKRSRNAFKKDYMGEPARYFADACGEASAVLEAKLTAIDHARRVEETK